MSLFDSSPVFIIGYMASGKTTFGRALARQLGREFIDLDFYIRQRFRKTIPEIFASQGEEEFRRIERRMLHEVGEFENVVIACGGGTPCFFDNMEYMNSRGLTVRLEASVQRIVTRLLLTPGRRPLTENLSDEELVKFVTDHLHEREPFYSEAQISFNGENLENSRQIETSVTDFLNIFS